jgi:hypothetical protein
LHLIGLFAGDVLLSVPLDGSPQFATACKIRSHPWRSLLLSLCERLHVAIAVSHCSGRRQAHLFFLAAVPVAASQEIFP